MANATKPRAKDVEIGQTLRTIRNARGFSQESLARQLGISFQQIQKYEKGINRLSISRAMDIAKVLEVPVTDIIAEEPAGVPLMITKQAASIAEAIARLRAPQRRAVLALIDTYTKENKHVRVS